MSIKDLRAGSIVILRPDFGSGNPVQVMITGVEEQGKNGKDVVDYVYPDGARRWAYTHQIDKVIEY
jgi:hypothetical protein